MEHLELLKQVIAAGEKMREAQKQYFRVAAAGGLAKSRALALSKQAEAEFDNTIFTVKQLIR